MSVPDQWLARRTAGAPDELGARVLSWVRGAEPGVGEAERLAAAGISALDAAVGQRGDRTAALDLLAADALVTLALLHQAERDAERLEEFARRVRIAAAERA